MFPVFECFRFSNVSGFRMFGIRILTVLQYSTLLNIVDNKTTAIRGLTRIVVSRGECPYCSPSGLQASIHPPSRQKRETNKGEREGQTFKGKGELCIMPQYPTIPPKWPRSCVTFHCCTVSENSCKLKHS